MRGRRKVVEVGSEWLLAPKKLPVAQTCTALHLELGSAYRTAAQL